MKKFRELMDKTILSTCVGLFMFMTAVGTYQIATRYIFRSPSTVSEELISYSFAWMAMLGASYIFGKRDHMKMVFFVEKFSKKVQLLFGILAEAVTFLFSLGVLVKGGMSITSLTMTQTTPALGVSMGYVYAIIPICGILICTYSLMNIGNLMTEEKEEK